MRVLPFLGTGGVKSVMWLEAGCSRARVANAGRAICCYSTNSFFFSPFWKKEGEDYSQVHVAFSLDEFKMSDRKFFFGFPLHRISFSICQRRLRNVTYHFTSCIQTSRYLHHIRWYRLYQFISFYNRFKLESRDELCEVLKNKADLFSIGKHFSTSAMFNSFFLIDGKMITLVKSLAARRFPIMIASFP